MFPLEDAMSSTESVLVTCSSLIVRSRRSGVTIRPIEAVAVDSTIVRPGESLVLRVRVLLMVDVVEDMMAVVLSLTTAAAQRKCVSRRWQHVARTNWWYGDGG